MKRTIVITAEFDTEQVDQIGWVYISAITKSQENGLVVQQVAIKDLKSISPAIPKNNNLSKMLKSLVKISGKSQKETANELGVAQSLFSCYLAGTRLLPHPSKKPDFYKKLARFLKLSKEQDVALKALTIDFRSRFRSIQLQDSLND